MNSIALIILIALLADHTINLIADHLNLKRIREEIPEPFQDIYKPLQYQKSQQYLRVNTRFGWIVASVDLGVILIFWFAKGFAVLDQWVRSLGMNPVVNGLIFMGVLLLVKAIFSLPFGIYATFVIEERFGFNKTTWNTFLMDKVKALVLALLLGTPILAAVMWFFEYAGHLAWLWCWGTVTVFTLVVQFIAPRWIMPLFNKFEPLEEGTLRSKIMAYARSIQFPLQNVFVMDGSKRSSKSNAFFTGFGRNRRIVLFDTLIEKHSVRELLAVLAHEMGHYKKRHIFKMLLAGICQMGVMFFVLSLFISRQELFDAFFVEEVSIYCGLIFFAMLYAPLDFFMGIFMQAISRKHEYEADSFAAKTTGDPVSMQDALKKLSMDNLANLLPHPFYVMLHYSHPPVLDRIAAIERAGRGL
jgi:STE24 endopeptidase